MGVAAARDERMSFCRTFLLSNFMNIVTYWIKQYICYYYSSSYLCAPNRKSTSSGHWGVTDGTDYRDLTEEKGNIKISELKPNTDKVPILYIPFFDFGVVGTGKIDAPIEIPKKYGLRNNCQLHAIKICCQSGYPIFRLLDYHVVLSCIIPFICFLWKHDILDFMPPKSSLVHSILSTLF